MEVENLYTICDFFKDDIFIRSDNFIGRGDRLEIFFLNSLALNTCIGSTYAGVAYFAKSVCVKNAIPKSTDTEGADIDNACTGGVSAIEHSKIHL